ncbi:hypothetical protein KL951_004957 [Ogataea haglerorum]|nr:hypothetical protein KL951_004957 [Ogataea haglerorum]
MVFFRTCHVRPKAPLVRRINEVFGDRTYGYFTANEALDVLESSHYLTLKNDLRLIYNTTVRAIEDKANKAARIRRGYEQMGMIPPVLHLSKDEKPLSESAIRSHFSNLCLKATREVTNPLHNSYWAGKKSLTLPSMPGSAASAIEWNDFIQKLVAYNTFNARSSQNQIDQAIGSAINIAGHKLTLVSFNKILLHFALKYDLTTMTEILDSMTTIYDLKPDIQTYNIFLNTILRSRAKHRVRRCISILNMMEQQGIAPNKYTWNIICGGLKDVHEILQFLRQFHKFQIPLLCQKNLANSGVQFPILKELFDPATKIDYSTAYDLLSLGIRVKLLEEGQLGEAFIYMQNVCSQSRSSDHSAFVLTPKFDILKLFMDYILFELQNLPYAIAFLQYFENSYPNVVDNDDNRNQLYAILLTSMKQFQDSPMWEPLVRYFFQRTIDDRGRTVLSTSTITQLTELGEQKMKEQFQKNTSNTFNITDSPTLIERTTINKIFKQLRWPGSAYGEQPIWELEKNAPSFRQACKMLGYFGNTKVDGPEKKNTTTESSDIWQTFELPTREAFHDSLPFDVAVSERFDDSHN